VAAGTGSGSGIGAAEESRWEPVFISGAAGFMVGEVLKLGR